MRMKQTYICPKCLKKFDIHVATWGIRHDNLLDRDVIVKPMEIRSEVYCNECDEFMFPCDDKMIYPVIGLNSKGYETLYCCEGHHSSIDPENVGINETCSLPYMVFVPYGIYNHENELFKQTYDICLTLAAKFKHISIEMNRNSDVQYQASEDDPHILNADRIDITARYHKETFTETEKLYGYTETTAMWKEAKDEFLRYLDILIEELPNIKKEGEVIGQ